jgi:putative hydrolase of the HAD superfamily
MPIATLFPDIWEEGTLTYPDMIGMVAHLKARRGLQIGVVSNDSLELNSHRIRMYKLDGSRKPDANIFRLALDITQTSSHQAMYIENISMLVQIAGGLGLRHILRRISSPHARTGVVRVAESRRSHP